MIGTYISLGGIIGMGLWAILLYVFGINNEITQSLIVFGFSIGAIIGINKGKKELEKENQKWKEEVLE